jgi:molecular chaperone GrpE
MAEVRHPSGKRAASGRRAGARSIHAVPARSVDVTQESDEGRLAAVSSEENGVAVLRAELEQERDRHLRTRAEFENYQRRVERDREESARAAKRGLLLELVDLADGFERALAHVAGSPDPVAAGLFSMQRRLNRVLEAEDAEPFESVGERFDPTRHEAMATVRDPGCAAGTVVDEVGHGYLWRGQLLRPARVRVAG